MKWKHLLIGSLLAGAFVSCNSTKLVPVAMTASVEEASLQFDFTHDIKNNRVDTVINRKSGKVVFTPMLGSAGFQLQRFTVEVFDETQAPLGDAEYTMSAVIPPVPLTGPDAGKVQPVSVAITASPVLPDTVEQSLKNSCLNALLDPGRGDDEPVCPQMKVRYTFKGISMADGTPVNLSATYDFQPTYTYKVKEEEN